MTIISITITITTTSIGKSNSVPIVIKMGMMREEAIAKMEIESREQLQDVGSISLFIKMLHQTTSKFATNLSRPNHAVYCTC
jgi:hypothetical protein